MSDENCKIVSQRGTNGRFLKRGEVSQTILDRIAHSKEVKANARKPRKAHVPKHKRELTHNPFAVLLAK